MLCCLVWFSVLLSSLLSARSEVEFKLPSYIDACYRDDPKLDKCLKKEIEKLIPVFRPGAKELDLAPLEPFEFKNLAFNYKSLIVGGNLEVPKIAFWNLTRQVRVLDIKSNVNDPKKFQLDFDAYFPLLNIKGKYRLAGNVLAIPVTMNGKLDFNLEYVTMSYHIICDVERIGQHDYLTLNTFDWRVKSSDIKNAYVNKVDLIEGSPNFSAAVIGILNGNWKILANNLLPRIFPVSDQLMKDFFKDLFKKYPYDIILPKMGKTTGP